MKKQIFILLCLVTFPLMAQQETFEIQIFAPESVVAGNDVVVKRGFNKGTPVNIVEAEEIAEPEEFATVIRQEPIVENNGIVYVSLLVKKPVGTNFLKLEEVIPGGYTFESIDASWAVVSQASSIARFVWMKMPSANSFLVKYRLIPILEKEQEEIKLEGNLTFTDAGETKVVPVKEMKVNLEAMNNSQHMLLLAKGTVPEGLPEAKSQLASTVAPVKKPVTPVAKKTATHEVIKERKSDVVPEKKQYKKSSGSSFINIEELESNEGVYFRVQVSAVKNPFFDKIYFAQYELLNDVKVEKIQGWSKYTVGSVSTYNQAVQLKDRIISETPQSSAFIVAYKDGKRVFLDEVSLD
jgi:hypothetical protein